MIVDTHCHVGPSKYEPVEALLSQMDRTGVDHAVITQHNGMYDNEYALEQVREHPDRLSLLAQIDPEAAAPLDDLDRLVDAGASGIRIPLRSPVAGTEFESLWERIDARQMPISLNGRPQDFASDRCEAILECCGDTVVIFEHLFGIGDIARPYDDHDDAFQVCLDRSERPNVFCKVPGPGEIFSLPNRLSRTLRYADKTDHFDRVFDRVAADRLMWGSDFPVCSSREGYANTRRGIEQLQSIDSEATERVLGRTAARVFNL